MCFMKYLIVFLFVIVGYIHAQEGIYRPTQHFVFPIVEVDVEADRPTSSVVDRQEHLDFVFQYAYAACLDREYNLPIWVSHHLNGDLLERNFNARPNGYPADAQLEGLRGSAYQSSGYDHGHLAPAADFQWDKTAYLQSFLMSNMSPQHGCFNQKGWCNLEGTLREWVKENPKLDLYIVSGAVVNEFVDTLCLPRDVKVYVPKYFYKVVLVMEPGKEPYAVGFLVPNEDVTFQDIPEFIMSVRDIENLTGLDFFSFLPRKVQDEVETVIPDVKLYDKPIGCPDKSCDSVYSRRVKADERSKLRCE